MRLTALLLFSSLGLTGASADDFDQAAAAWYGCVFEAAFRYGKTTTESVDLVARAAFGSCKGELNRLMTASGLDVTSPRIGQTVAASEDMIRDKVIARAMAGRAASQP